MPSSIAHQDMMLLTLSFVVCGSCRFSHPLDTTDFMQPKLAKVLPNRSHLKCVREANSRVLQEEGELRELKPLSGNVTDNFRSHPEVNHLV